MPSSSPTRRVLVASIAEVRELCADLESKGGDTSPLRRLLEVRVRRLNELDSKEKP